MDTLSHTLPQVQRLDSRSRIERLFGEGRRGGGFPVRYVVLCEEAPVTQQADVAMMVSVPKRLHKRAHTRNLLKRRIREAYRLNKEPLREYCRREGVMLSVGFLYTASTEFDYHTIEDAVRKIIRTLAPEC